MANNDYNKGGNCKGGIRVISFLLFYLFTFLLFTSCGGSEDIDVSFKNPSLNFQPADSDQTFTAQLRRNFQEKYGSYLLFSDTLQHVYQGDDYNGNPIYFTEKLDIDYSVGESAGTNASYWYTLIYGDSLRQFAVDFLEGYVLPHFTGKMKPYSWFLCMRVNGTDNMGNTISANTYTQTGQRAVIVAYNYLLSRQRNASQTQAFATRVINGIVGQIAYNNSDAFSEFYTYSNAYYGVSLPDPTPTTVQMRQLGFISTGSGTYPTQRGDLIAYVQNLVATDYETLLARYSNYPVIQQKFAVARQVLLSLGYVF